MKTIGYIAGTITIITALSGFAWKAFSWDRQIQQNSKSIAIFTLDRIDRQIDYLQKKRASGNWSRTDCRQLREMLRQKAKYECQLYKICNQKLDLPRC